MIAEDVLERGLAAAADDYAVPDDGIDAVRELLAPRVQTSGDAGDGGTGGRLLHRAWPPRRPGRGGWLTLAAASLVVLIAVSLALGGGGTSSSGAIQHDLAGPAAAGAGAAGAGAAATKGADHGSVSSTRSDAVRMAPSIPAAPQVAGSSTSAGTPLTAGGGTSSSEVGSGSVDAPPNVPPGPINTVPERIVKTGELDLEVAKGQVSTTLNRLTGLATLENGYVADSRTDEAGDSPSGSVTLRVPVRSFEAAISRARTYGTKVLSLVTSAHDVTSKYVDLGARISALQKTRATFLTLLAKARTIGETLAVQQRVSDVQSQIERLQGQRKVLANRSALSTLTVTVNQKPAAVANHKQHEKSGFVKAVDRSVSRFVRGVEAIVGVIGPLLLALLLVGLAWLAWRVGYRRLRRRLV